MAWSELAIILRRNGSSPERPPWAALSDQSLSAAERDAVLQAIIADLDERGNVAGMIRALTQEPNADARRLALEIATRSPRLDPVLVARLRPLLRDRRIPESVLLNGAAQLLKIASPKPKQGIDILRDFAAGYGRKRVLKNQQLLQMRLGVGRTFDRFCADLKRAIPLRCPQCGVRRRPIAMERHLWRRHHQLLVKGRVRSPLRWLDQLASRQSVIGDIDSHLDAVSRHITSRRLNSTEALAARQALATRKSASVCPHCSAIVEKQANAAVDTESIQPLELSRNRMSGEGWIVERAAHGISTVHRIHEPDGAVATIADAAGRWSQTPAIRWLVLPWVVLALLMAATLPAAWTILGTALALSGAYAWRILVRAMSAPTTSDALIDTAWAQIIQPRGESDEIPWRFASRLAVTSSNLGSPGFRRPVVRSLGDRSQFGDVGSAHRAALLGLLTRDADATCDDPLPPLLDAINQVLVHDRPIDEIERIVDCTSWREWSPGRRARLRIALTERAFAAGLGVWEWIELGTIMPRFGEWISADNLDSVAQLHGLWRLRSDRGWEACGPAATAFELANYPVHEETFSQSPDLLLDVPMAKFGEHIWLRGCGMTFHGTTIHRPRPIEVHVRPMNRGYELTFGTERIRFKTDPSDLAHALNAWSQYHFGTLLAAADAATGQPNGALLERLLESKTIKCPECNGIFRNRSSVTAHDFAG